MTSVGFSEVEVQKMESLLNEFKEESLKDDFCKNVARAFNRSSGRAGKPVVKWPEIQNWFRENLEKGLLRETSLDAGMKLQTVQNYLSPNKDTSGVRDAEHPGLEFEARSSKDGAWYDVDTFIAHRFLDSGETEFLIRYVGLGTEEDEWVNPRNSLRERSIAMDQSDCHKVKIGDEVVCFQERDDEGKYFDAHVMEIERRWHDIRGCRCFFLIKYNHDDVEEKVRLRRLCSRPRHRHRHQDKVCS